MSMEAQGDATRGRGPVPQPAGASRGRARQEADPWPPEGLLALISILAP